MQYSATDHMQQKSKQSLIFFNDAISNFAEHIVYKTFYSVMIKYDPNSFSHSLCTTMQHVNLLLVDIFIFFPIGNGVAGIVLPESEEKVLAIKKGDAIALPFGVVTWWYNEEDTELIVLFLGDTSKAHKAGEFTEFFLTGSNGIFTGFSTEFVSRAWDLDENVVKILVGKQSGIGIVKLDGNFKMPEL